MRGINLNTSRNNDSSGRIVLEIDEHFRIHKNFSCHNVEKVLQKEPTA